MYRAIVEIGEYKVGEEVPTEKAEYWLKVYKIPQVEKVDEEVKESEPEEETKKEVDFYNELIAIKGIGHQTAEDIIEVFSREKLINAIKNKEKLPFRNDIEKKLREKYG